MAENKMQVTITQFIDNDHQFSAWYGGQCAVIKYKGYTASLEAVGDIDWDYTKDGESLASFKDKYNSGRFYDEMAQFIKNDAELALAVAKDELVFFNNNWWECFIYDPEGGFHDLMWDLDACLLMDAISEVKDNFDYIIATYIEHEEEEE